MSKMSDYLEGQLRAHIFRTASFTKPTALWISLHTADPLDDASGTEVSITATGYGRVNRAPLDANWSAASATDGITKNVADIVFGSPVDDWGQVTHFGIWDAETGGNLLIHGALTTPKTVNNGDPAPKFVADSLVITFA